MSPSVVVTRASTPSLETRPSDIVNSLLPPYTTASITTCHTNNASDYNIQELFAGLQTQGGVAAECFWQIFHQCKFCQFIVKKNSHHSCTSIIDLTVKDNATIIDLTNDNDATIIDLTGNDNKMD
jgi:hypothetical protein